MKKIFPMLWIFSAILLFLYSYTQVDLSLTLSRASVVRDIETGFQHIGWFQRPLSTALYIGLLCILFGMYLATIKLVQKKKIPKKVVWMSIIAITGILTFSYNAFSYDLFNYIFDAKIVTFYHQNPYIHKALDFPNDPMLSFMRWTHRVYPYGPLWLGLTIPFSYAGMKIFIVTYFLFKIFLALCFLLSCFLIDAIAKQYEKEHTSLPLVLFALNPLVLVECLVSSHNDIAMISLALAGVYFILKNQKINSTVVLLASVLVKFVTALLIVPFIVYVLKNKKTDFLVLSFLSMIIAILLASLRTNFQPWYLLYAIPFACLLYKKSYALFPLLILSITGLVYYIPFLFTGNWDPPIPQILNNLVFGGVTVSLLLVLTERFIRKGRADLL